MFRIYIRHLLMILMLCVELRNTKCSNTQSQRQSLMRRSNTSTSDEALLKLQQFKTKILEKTSNAQVPPVNSGKPNCMQMQCKFICFGGKANRVAYDIKQVEITKCTTIEELRLYSYQFPNQRISYGFLGEYADKVELLYVASANVSSVEGGAFAGGIYRELHFEDLKFEKMQKSFFVGITSSFEALSIVQRTQPLLVVCSDFLDQVKYQIKRLTLQVGINCVRNITAANNLLNNLAYVDFSYNNLGGQLISTTFSRLSMVEHMDLSHSNISYLPDYIFSYVTDTLTYLDVSYNHLTTISSTIFGWREVSRSLKILASGNDWNCTCVLHQEMKNIFQYQATKSMYCVTPQEYVDWSVFDGRLCEEDVNIQLSTHPTHTTQTTQPLVPSTSDCPFCEGYTTTTVILHISPTPPKGIAMVTVATTATEPISAATQSTLTSVDDRIVQLMCASASGNSFDNSWQEIKRASLQFHLVRHPNSVDVILLTEELDDLYGLVWFSKVTKHYYKMLINYNDYGLGCYSSISYITTVDNLLPGESYTFCLVLRNQTTISPFNCKSIYMNSNFQVTYNAWLTEDMRPTGISLVVFGIILLIFVGILLVFSVLKHKPTLIKGSKRVATTKGKPGEIVVFPKDKTFDDFRLKEEMLAKRCSRSTISRNNRRDSNVSIDSNQSYMNGNLYEMIPAYLQFDRFYASQQDTFPPYSITNKNSCVRPPLDSSIASDANFVSYAEIPYRTKRTSGDPLPELPCDEAPHSLPMSEFPEHTRVVYATTLDSQV